MTVRPLWEAAAAGLLSPVVRVSTSGASAEPTLRLRVVSPTTGDSSAH